MSRLTTVDPAQATGETSELLDATQRTFGVIPNLAKILASSPAALKTWLESIRALAAGQLDPGLRERIALGVAETNGCGYCLSAHTYVAKHVAHLSDQAIEESRRLSSADPKVDAIIAHVALSVPFQMRRKSRRVSRDRLALPRSSQTYWDACEGRLQAPIFAAPQANQMTVGSTASPLRVYSRRLAHATPFGLGDWRRAS